MSCPGRTDVRIITGFAMIAAIAKPPASSKKSHSPETQTILEKGLGVRGKGKRDVSRCPFPRYSKYRFIGERRVRRYPFPRSLNYRYW